MKIANDAKKKKSKGATETVCLQVPLFNTNSNNETVLVLTRSLKPVDIVHSGYEDSVSHNATEDYIPERLWSCDLSWTGLHDAGLACMMQDWPA